VLPVPFIVLRYVTFISSFFRAFIMKKCWILLKADFLHLLGIFCLLFYLCAVLHVLMAFVNPFLHLYQNLSISSRFSNSLQYKFSNKSLILWSSLVSVVMSPFDL
jgi:hypothetical protein